MFRRLIFLGLKATLIIEAFRGSPLQSQREQVTRLVTQVQRADYEGDRAALQRLYEQLGKYANDRDLGPTVSYWRGFAMWRRAINGVNDSVPNAELIHDQELAVSEFERAISKDSGFVEAKVAAGSSMFYLAYFARADTARVSAIIPKAIPLINSARSADPDNPRLLWMVGGSRFNAPKERGGSQEAGIEIYQKGLESARQRGASSDPLVPSWGEPELLMSLAWSSLNRATPDVAAAEEYGKSALALVPYWHYMRDILMPQILAAKAKQG